jgi:hypothetical protein
MGKEKTVLNYIVVKRVRKLKAVFLSVGAICMSGHLNKCGKRKNIRG